MNPAQCAKPDRAGSPAPAASTAASPIASPVASARAAAIVDDGSCSVDELLAEAAERERRAGRRVRGLVMQDTRGRSGCAGEMVLVDLGTGERYPVSQPLGASSTACRADPQGFARASEVLRRAAGEAPDLVICNRFGRLEAEGGGFRAELLELMARELPLLTSVAERYVDAWRSFTGDAATVLPADAAAVQAWLGAQVAPPVQPVPSAPRAQPG